MNFNSEFLSILFNNIKIKMFCVYLNFFVINKKYGCLGKK